MTSPLFTLRQVRPIRDGMTVSRPAGLGGEGSGWFVLMAFDEGTGLTPQGRFKMSLLLVIE